MLRAVRAARLRNGIPSLRAAASAATAPFTTSGALPVKQMPPRPKPPPEEEILESYLRGSGPGGQKIVWTVPEHPVAPPEPSSLELTKIFHAKQNKTSSAVQLKHLPTGVVVKSQATRSREQNRKIARDLLAAKLDAMRNGDQSRAAIVGEVKRKKSASASKKSRRKYRKLEEEKAEGTTEEGKAANTTEDRDSGSK